MSLPAPAACPIHGVPDNCADLMRRLAEPEQQPRTVVVRPVSGVPAQPGAVPPDPRVAQAREANRASLRSAAWVVGGVLALIVALTLVKLLGWINLSIPGGGGGPQPGATATVTVTSR
ncbi:hypothetical protein ACWGB8_37515 [Kitasatospora sp. NPDC054939]